MSKFRKKVDVWAKTGGSVYTLDTNGSQVKSGMLGKLWGLRWIW